jgi:hypothetical protein
MRLWPDGYGVCIVPCYCLNGSLCKIHHNQKPTLQIQYCRKHSRRHSEHSLFGAVQDSPSAFWSIQSGIQTRYFKSIPLLAIGFNAYFTGCTFSSSKYNVICVLHLHGHTCDLPCLLGNPPTLLAPVQQHQSHPQRTVPRLHPRHIRLLPHLQLTVLPQPNPPHNRPRPAHNYHNSQPARHDKIQTRLKILTLNPLITRPNESRPANRQQRIDPIHAKNQRQVERRQQRQQRPHQPEGDGQGEEV